MIELELHLNGEIPMPQGYGAFMKSMPNYVRITVDLRKMSGAGSE